MKKLLLSSVLLLYSITHAVDRKNIIEGIFRKVNTIEDKTCTMQPQVTNIQNNVIKILEEISSLNLSVADCQVSGLDDLENQVSILSEVLCSKIENLLNVTSTNDSLILTAIDNIEIPPVTVSGIDELSVQISLGNDMLCSKLEALEQLTSQDDALILTAVENITVNVDVDNTEVINEISQSNELLCSKLEALEQLTSQDDALILTAVENITVNVDVDNTEVINEISQSNELLCSKLEALEQLTSQDDALILTAVENITVNVDVDNTEVINEISQSNELLCSKLEALEQLTSQDDALILTAVENITVNVDVDNTEVINEISQSNELLCSKLEALEQLTSQDDALILTAVENITVNVDVDNTEVINEISQSNELLCSKIEALEQLTSQDDALILTAIDNVTVNVDVDNTEVINEISQSNELLCSKIEALEQLTSQDDALILTAIDNVTVNVDVDNTEVINEISQSNELLCSKLEIIESKVDTVDSQADVIESKIDGLRNTLESDVSVLSEVLCSKLENLEILTSINDALILTAIDNIECPSVTVSGLDELSLQVSLSTELLCSKLEVLEQLTSQDDALILTAIDNITVNVDNTEVINEISQGNELLCSKLEIIESKIDVVDSQVDEIDSQADVIESKIDILTDDLGSIGDTLCNKSVLTQSAIEGLASGQGFVSTFGEAITSRVEDMINIQFQYGIADVEITTSLIETGTYLAEDSLAKVSTGPDPAGMGRIESRRNLRYRTGHEGYAFFTALWETSAADSTQFIGLLDDDNGAAVGFNGTTFSILFRRAGDADTFIPQSSFNKDPLDGTGSSGFTLDTTKLNIFRVSYGWLGTAPIKFQINREDGKWITFHVIERPNTTAGVHFINPVLPIRMEALNSGNTTNLTMASASWNAGIVGPPTTSGSRFFSKSNLLTISSADTETHLLTIRNKDTFQGLDNKIEVRIAALGGGSLATASEVVLFRLRRNATVTGTSFTDVNTSSSVMELSTVGTYAGGGEEIFIFPNNTFGSGPTVLFFPRAEFTILMFPGEELTLTGVSLQSGAADTIGILTWEEQF